MDISVGEVLRVIDGPLMVVRSVATNPDGSEDPRGKQFRAIWAEVQEAMSEVVDRMSFADLVSNYEKEFEVRKKK
jgi:DNA-binding IscR family transcriptional regulator